MDLMICSGSACHRPDVSLVRRVAPFRGKRPLGPPAAARAHRVARKGRRGCHSSRRWRDKLFAIQNNRQECLSSWLSSVFSCSSLTIHVSPATAGLSGHLPRRGDVATINLSFVLCPVDSVSGAGSRMQQRNPPGCTSRALERGSERKQVQVRK